MSKRKIVISEYDNIAALMEDDRAVEFIIHRGDMLLGDVYLATVENILPSIDAAFLNVGGDKMGFLHSSDVPGKGDLKDRLEPKQQLVVQIMKEPTGHKGPRVSTNISLPGRFLVMMPESKGISISRKIMESAERSRLKSVVSLIKPPGVGVIIRTEAANQKESDITEDFETLLERWQNIVSMADTASPPTLLYRDQDLLYRVIREAVTEDVTEIVVDSAFGQQRAQQLLQNWNMDKGVKVTHFQGSQPILVGTGVDKEIKLALQTKVALPSGGYLYIQPTEALAVIDVNSGKFTSLQSQAETIKLTNLEACKEIARQLRLRNIGGMIVVDFIDMESRANQLQVMQTFENELLPDKAKPQIGQLSDLGLVEMTRHRQGQSLSEIFTRRCHSCSGTGHALEEFSWLHPGGEGEGRGNRQGGRHNNNNPKVPTRQGNRLQQVPKPAASVHQRRDKGRVLLANLEKSEGKSDGKKEGSKENQANASVVPGSMMLNNLAEQRGQAGGQSDRRPGNEPSETLLEVLTEKLHKKYGIRLALAAKLSYLPTGINSILSRIHPKANDIVSLVNSIEGTASEPSSRHSGRYDDGEDNDSDEGDDDGDSDEQPEQDAEAPTIDLEAPEFGETSDIDDEETSPEVRSRRPRGPRRPAPADNREERGEPNRNPDRVLPVEVGQERRFQHASQAGVAPGLTGEPVNQASMKPDEAVLSQHSEVGIAKAPLGGMPVSSPDVSQGTSVLDPGAVDTHSPAVSSVPAPANVESEHPQAPVELQGQPPMPDVQSVEAPVAADDSHDQDDAGFEDESGEDHDGDDEEGGDAEKASAKSAAGKRRRGGRPAKRSIKKPSAKRP